jgi:ATP-binding cassette, subfamily B (MDR/TAP), member 7
MLRLSGRFIRSDLKATKSIDGKWTKSHSLNRYPIRVLSSKNDDPATKEPAPPENYNTRMLKLLAKHLWPDAASNPNSKEIKARVLTSMSFMVGAKLITIQVPFLFRDLIDNFGAEVAKVSAAAAEESSASGGVDTMATAATGGQHLVQGIEMSESAVHALNTMMTEPMLAAPLALVIGYGVARTSATAAQEFRSAIFSNVAQHAIRRVSGDVFEHLMSRDLQFHLDRKIGALSRVIDRGGRSIQFALTSMLFSVVPTALEIGT